MAAGASGGGISVRIDLPCCPFKNCKHCFDGNCKSKIEYERCEFMQILKILGDDYDLDRLRELVQADREERCGIPPVKLHQTIYRVFDGKILEEKVCKAVWEPFMPRPRWKVWVMGSGLPYYWDDCVGKTVFLTRKAAEAALKGE